MNYFIPGKTFLVGEYAALLDGPALGLATLPCFEASFLAHENPTQIFNPESLAGLLYEQKREFFKSKQLQFTDPYSGKGGFGRSTAEYLSVLIPQIDDIECPQRFMKVVCFDYRKLSKDQVKPSGYDLLFQLLGKVSYVDVSTDKFESVEWPFLDLGFYIVSTGVKLKTYEHLKNLDMKKIEGLPQLAQLVVQSFIEKNENQFLTKLSEWTVALAQRGLLAEQSLQLKQKLELSSAVCMVKPCGAMGSDTLIVFFNPKNHIEVKSLIEQLNLAVVASNHSLHKGLLRQLKKFLRPGEVEFEQDEKTEQQNQEMEKDKKDQHVD